MADWHDISVCFSQSLWGLKAIHHQTQDQRLVFLYPLTITEIVAGGEAEKMGVKVGDVVVKLDKVNVTHRKNLLDIPTSGKKRYICEGAQDILMRGGSCTMQLQRRRDTSLCSSCGSNDTVEISHEGKLVARPQFNISTPGTLIYQPRAL